MLSSQQLPSACCLPNAVSEAVGTKKRYICLVSTCSPLSGQTCITGVHHSMRYRQATTEMQQALQTRRQEDPSRWSWSRAWKLPKRVDSKRVLIHGEGESQLRLLWQTGQASVSAPEATREPSGKPGAEWVEGGQRTRNEVS